MLTIFAIPKAFRGHIAIIQRNAIISWTLLRPKCEIILFGDDEGTGETARELGVRHVPEVARNEYGTPLVNDAFRQAQKLATYDLLCYVNADILLMRDFISAVERLRLWHRQFLMVGKRWGMAISDPLDFDQPSWERKLSERVRRFGVPGTPYGLDYFVFSRGVFDEDLPPFAIGRPFWDNWFIWKAKTSQIPVVDASRSIMVVHQDHDSILQPEGWEDVLRGKEVQGNWQLAGEGSRCYTTHHATYMLVKEMILYNIGLFYLFPRWQYHVRSDLGLTWSHFINLFKRLKD